ncbi:MAG: tail fiber domain-containing protein [Vicinamibacterales bacterium]
MAPARLLPIALALSVVVFAVVPASAQPLGSFFWQLQPYCNVVTFNVTYSFTPTGPVYTLDGFDDMCGAATRAAASGVAFPNPDGSIGLGFSIVSAPEADVLHVDARVSLANLSGTWAGEGGIGGTFAYGTVAPGLSPRPASPTALLLTQFGSAPRILTRRAEGSAAAPTAVLEDQLLGSLGGGGHTGSAFTGATASMQVAATEDWTPTAQGSRLNFLTTANGSPSSAIRMTIEASGNVGIGTVAPLSLLHVNGAIRVGNCTFDPNTGAPTCFSDARFKRDVKALTPMLDRLTRLQPVQYAWRADEFPDKAFTTGDVLGLVAQDVEAVLPELVTTDAQGYKSVNYGQLPLLAVQALKEMKARMDAVQRENADLAARLSALEAVLAQAPRARR